MNKTNFIELNKNKICLHTKDTAAEYAFYLYFKESVEKVMYSKNNQAFFDIKKGSGLYKAVFFKKQPDGARIIDSLYFCIDKNNIVKPVELSVLSDVEEYKITSYDIKSDITFIVFMETNTTKNTRPFGLDYLLSREYNVIACNQNNNQYQGLSYDSFKEIVLPAVHGKKVYLYGSSLGGYCAVYYAGAVNGTVIAGAPRNSAHPSMLDLVDYGFYSADDFKHQDIIENPISKKNVYIFLDPHQSRDVFFIEKFIKPAYGNQVQLIRFPHAGHEVLHHVNKTKQLSNIINSIISESFMIDSIDYDLDSEFSLYMKADFYYNKLKKALDKYYKLGNRHPTAEVKMKKLQKAISEL